MNSISQLPEVLSSAPKSRSMGVKLIVVCGLALLMIIPALFVYGILDERTSRAADVTREISNAVGGPQTFLGPTLAIPYAIPPQTPGGGLQHGTYFVFPAQAAAKVKTTTEERRRSLFKVPVFQATLDLDATFDLTDVPAAAPPGAVLDWGRAEIVVGVSDARGALADALLTLNGKTAALAPATISQRISISEDQSQSLSLTLFGLPAGDTVNPGAQFNVSSTLQFFGAQRLAVLAYGKTTHITMQSDWPNPSFDGGFLPVNKSISASGFTADWSVPFIARGVRAEGSSDQITGLNATAAGVSFVELADPYQSVNRSLKYAPLFLGLLFLTYFVFEATTGKRIHPAQYLLVGIAQIIFYLLLLSLAERIGFDLGFLIGGTATVLLLAANARWIFNSITQGLRALIIFALLYGLIYILLRLEDNALLVGAIASFLAVAATMYFTRRTDWYSSISSAAGGRQSGPTQTGVPQG